MGKYRIYPQKSNTLIEGTNINTGENEITELWYGGSGATRHLLQFNFDAYNAAYALGYVPNVTATTAEFKLVNCYPIFEKDPYSDAEPATSVDMEAYVVQQAWDGGVGYDFRGSNTVNGFSNWYSATTTVPWGAAGGDYANLVFSGHIDKGYEDFSGSTLDYDLLWDTFTGDNHGLLVKYAAVAEALTGSSQTILKYYTDNARTTYKIPYIELTWDGQIKDEREELGNELTRRLYLYVKYSNVFSTPNDISGVTIEYDNGSYSSETYVSSAITQQYPGVYYIDYTGPAYFSGQQTFTDTWYVQFGSGDTHTGVVQNGDLFAGISQWSTGQTDVLEAVNYAITMPNLSSRYNKGDFVYLDVRAYEQHTSTVVVIRNMEFKIVLIDGGNDYNYTMVDWSPVGYFSDINGFSLNTSWFHSGYIYEIQFRYTANGALVKTPKDTFKFKVVDSL